MGQLNRRRTKQQIWVICCSINERIYKKHLIQTEQDDQDVNEYLSNYLKNVGKKNEIKSASQVAASKKLRPQNKVDKVLSKKEGLNEEERKGLKTWQEELDRMGIEEMMLLTEGTESPEQKNKK